MPNQKPNQTLVQGREAKVFVTEGMKECVCSMHPYRETNSSQ